MGKAGAPLSPSIRAPEPAKQVKVLFFYKRNEQAMEAQVSGPTGHKEAQKGWKFPAVGCCFPLQGSRLHYVCDQWENGALPDPGDPQPPGPCQKGRGCRDCRSHFNFISSGCEGAGNRDAEWGGCGQTCGASLLSQTAAWGTLGTLRTFLSFSVDKDVQRLLRAIAGQGEPPSLCTWGGGLAF